MKRLLGVCLTLALVQVLIGCAPVTPASPANFSVTSLSVMPNVVYVGATATITIQITNSGGTEGFYPLQLKVNDVKQVEKTFLIAAGKTETVSYSVTITGAGDNRITVGEANALLRVVKQTPVYQ